MKKFLLYLSFIAAPILSYSQNLGDFKTAASADGVNLIPFSDLRQEAASIADDVQRRKDEAAAFNYETFESQKNNFLKDIKKRNDEIESIKKDIADFSKRYTEFSTSCFDAEIDKRKKSIDEINSKIKDMNDKMKDAVEAFGRLYNARAGLREHFEKALSQLSDAKSNPNRILGDSPSDDDKKSLEEAINKIQDQIQAGIQGHKEQEEGAKKRQADYQALIDRTEPK